jgi:hypothetical protein
VRAQHGWIGLALLLTLSTGGVRALHAAADSRSLLAERVMALTRDSRWTLVDRVAVSFKTFHPQGMVRIGDTFYVSSVEVRNRAAGDGVGHLFVINRAGQLIKDLTLGEGPIYHPGGIDYDGTDIWVPVAEYRPDSRAIVYRVSPETLSPTKVLTVDDHIGAIVHDVATHSLHGASWGSRRFYRWMLDAQGRVAGEPTRRLNPSHYVDYQDCKSAGAGRMLCTGVTEIRRGPDTPAFRLGGLELIDLTDARPLYQVPVLLWTPDGHAMTQNPAWFEPMPAGLRGYFMPEDDTSTIYIYDVATP